MSDERAKIPRSREDDYSPEIIAERQAFIEAETGVTLNHTKQFSYDPHVMSGNIENIWGVSQIPIGIAGPLLVDGEYAKGRRQDNRFCGVYAARTAVYFQRCA